MHAAVAGGAPLLTDGGKRRVEGKVEVNQRQQAASGERHVPPAGNIIHFSDGDCDGPARSQAPRSIINAIKIRQGTYSATYCPLELTYLWNTCDGGVKDRDGVKDHGVHATRRSSCILAHKPSAHLIIHGKVVKVSLKGLAYEAGSGRHRSASKRGAMKLAHNATCQSLNQQAFTRLCHST